MYQLGMKVSLCWFGVIGILILLVAIPQSEAAKNIWTPLGGPFYEDVYVNALAVNPKDSSIIFTGTNRGVYKSIDSGNSWQLSSKGMMVRTDVKALAINPIDPKIIFAGTDRGVYKSTDFGDSWMQIPIGGILALAINPIAPNIIYAISWDVYRSKDSGQTWEKINLDFSNVRALAINPKEPNIIYAGTHGDVYRSANSGDSWQRIDTGRYMVFKEGTTLVIDPINPNIIYAGTKDIIFNGVQEGGVYRSIDSGSSWKQITVIRKGIKGYKNGYSHKSGKPLQEEAF